MKTIAKILDVIAYVCIVFLFFLLVLYKPK